jgi:adenylate kinase
VDDEVMIGLVRERTSQPDARQGFVLDGFPRTVPQAEALDAMLAERGERIEVVVYLEASEDELVRRLQGRRECPVCKRAYNPEGAPARDGVHCDDHPAVELRLRPDDGEDVVRRRFAEFRAKTAPLVDYYTVTGRLRPVAGMGTVDGVFEALRREASLGSRTPQTN